MSRPMRSAPALAAPLLIFVSACASRTDPTTGRVSTPTAGGATPGQHTDWLQFGFDAARSGVNPKETRSCCHGCRPARPPICSCRAAKMPSCVYWTATT
jgi:hypothetical protein